VGSLIDRKNVTQRSVAATENKDLNTVIMSLCDTSKHENYGAPSFWPSTENKGVSAYFRSRDHSAA